VRPAGVDSKTRTEKDDGSHDLDAKDLDAKDQDLDKVRRFVARAKSLQE
jgi:hypothetical protein